MFYIFIFLFAIATIVVYVLQKDDEQKHTLKAEHGENPAHLDAEATLEGAQPAEVPIPPTTPPQSISQEELHTETSTARQLSTQADAMETRQDDMSSDRDLTPKDSSSMEQQETTPASRKLTPEIQHAMNTHQEKSSPQVTFKEVAFFVKEIVLSTMLVTVVILAIIAVLLLLLWVIKADWAATLLSGFTEAGWVAILQGIMLFSLLIGFSVVLSFIPTAAWLKSRQAGVPVDFLTVLSMRIRRVNPNMIVNAWIMAVNAGLKLTIHDLEAHAAAGGNVERVIAALIAAKNTNTSLSFEQATTLDLAGNEDLEAVLNQK